MKHEIECPVCNWQPDGDPHWQCSCGHIWNTFETKGKCPSCEFQWLDTWCPGCGKTSSHTEWYVDPDIVKPADNPETELLKQKKEKLENRLIELGIKDYRVSHLPYLDHTHEVFHSPYEAGCRMLILYAVSYAAQLPELRHEVIEWLKKEKLWDKASGKEILFLTKEDADEDELLEQSWRVEAAIVLAWALNLLDTLPPITSPATDEETRTFQNCVPDPGTDTHFFLNQLRFRDLSEIYEENLLNELATTYFRDLMSNGLRDETSIHRIVSFQRHLTLNWLRKFMGQEDWDETDTST
jgi:hypothetical protein